MKKILLIFIFMAINLFAPAFSADIRPVAVNHNDKQVIGVYQVPKNIVLYKDADEKSDIINSIAWSSVDIFPPSAKFDDLFVMFLPKKELGFAAVVDETDDWVQIIYNQSTGAKGWLKKDDPYKFLNWINFYNMYGRKYGLYTLKGAPECAKILKSATDDSSQTVAVINMPTKIKLNVIRGNWALVSVLDIDRMPKTGYVRWRGDDGIKYLFPDVK